MTEEQIAKINSKLTTAWDQGLYTEPWGIDAAEKRLVVYQRVKTGGARGGSCWGGSPRAYTEPEAMTALDSWEALDAVLEELAPNITYLQYRKIKNTLVRSNEKDEYLYYGNYDEYYIRWIPLDDLIKFCKELNQTT